MWVVPGPCLVCAVATPGWGPSGWRCWPLFASPAGVRGDVAIQVIYCAGVCGDGGVVVGDVSWLLSFRVTSLAGMVWMVLWVLVSLVMPTVSVSHVILGGWRFLWWSDGEGVAGRRVPPLLAGGLACAGGRLPVSWLAVLVVPVVSGVGVVPSPILGSAVVSVAPVYVEGVDAVGGWRCCCDAAVSGAGDVVGEGAAGGARGVGAAGDADGEGVVGDDLVDGGALTVPWGWDLASPGGGSRGCCWSVRWPWRCWPCLVSGCFLVSLMPMVLQVLYRVMPRARALWVVSLRLLSLMLRVAVAEVPLWVVLLLMLVVRALRAMLRFTVSLVWPMFRALLVVLVWVRVWAVSGLCSGVGCLCSRVGAGWSRWL